MYIEWDEHKNAANIEKHGIDFADAGRIFEGPVLERIDDRMYFGETRIAAVGMVEGRDLFIIYTVYNIFNFPFSWSSQNNSFNRWVFNMHF